MSRSTISTFKIFEMFPDAETARLYLEQRYAKYRPKKLANLARRGLTLGSRVPREDQQAVTMPAVVGFLE